MLTIEWLSGRTSEYRIWRSEVRFLIGTQNFFFVPCLWQEKKHLSLFLYRAHNLPLSYSIYNKILITNLKHALNFWMELELAWKIWENRLSVSVNRLDNIFRDWIILLWSWSFLTKLLLLFQSVFISMTTHNLFLQDKYCRFCLCSVILLQTNIYSFFSVFYNYYHHNCYYCF